MHALTLLARVGLDLEIKIGMMQCKDNGARRVVADLFVEGGLKFDHFLNWNILLGQMS